ncbi:hypothetical protein M2302_001858 [Micromonospora sp. A200]|uniref:hypothetical protein n=1 Tax=Micromonospora sp. A200 TaxID=2940568 RepID=UPI002476F0E4|nr:hypothetical protein [Micromonospora sp. A200]MDH6461683.1 hypothetical protein [Micromonospora sp. A200]
MTTHGPVMPIWSCGGCDLPWPCPTRKRELRAEYADAPVSLALYLGSYLVQAAEDMPCMPAGALHHRFLGWTREADRSTPAVQQRSTATKAAERDQDERHQAV